MTDIVLVDSSKRQVTLLIGAANNPTDKVFVVLLCRKGIHISEAIQLKESDVDFTKGTLSIIHLKERIKSKCPGCSAILGKCHFFCHGCGNKGNQAIRQKGRAATSVMVKRAVLETDRMRVNYKTALTAIGFEANPWIGVYF